MSGAQARRCILPLQAVEASVPRTRLTPQTTVASGGLSGLGLDEDLLRWEVTPPERAPADYRAVSYSAQHTRSGSGATCILHISRVLITMLLSLSIDLHAGRAVHLSRGSEAHGDSERLYGKALSRLKASRVACLAQAALAPLTPPRRRCSSTWSALCSRRRRSER